ncbi:MAG: succinate dehydrogenase, cytochrome b556 subunit [Sphingomonas sp.]
MSRNAARPLSPHLSIWRWGPHMLVSILHRATGIANAIGGGVLFIWWLLAAASGPAAYETFYSVATSWFGYLVGIGFTWTFFQHMFTGLRHFVLDTGAGYDLRTNRTWAVATIAGSIAMTLLVWGTIYARSIH